MSAALVFWIFRALAYTSLCLMMTLLLLYLYIGPDGRCKEVV